MLMTLHVALVGTDGIVLAGDRQILTRGEDDFAITSLGSKIKTNSKAGVAVAWAGGDIARLTADDLARQFETLKDEDSIRQFLSRSFQKHRAEVERKRQREELLVISTRDLSRFVIATYPTDYVSWEWRSTKDFIGARASCGYFFSERYYRKLPVRRLIPLAAMVILQAGQLNEPSISGLQIVTCTSVGIRELKVASEEACVRLRERVDRYLEEQLLTPLVGSE
jgi:hypothetical protein